MLSTNLCLCWRCRGTEFCFRRGHSGCVWFKACRMNLWWRHYIMVKDSCTQPCTCVDTPSSVAHTNVLHDHKATHCYSGLTVLNEPAEQNVTFQQTMTMEEGGSTESKSVTPVVFAAARCCLSLSSRLSSSLTLASTSSSFEFSRRPASTMASVSIKNRPSVSPSLRRPRWDKSEAFEKPISLIFENWLPIFKSICVYPKKLGSIFCSLFSSLNAFWVLESVSTSFS